MGRPASLSCGSGSAGGSGAGSDVGSAFPDGSVGAGDPVVGESGAELSPGGGGGAGVDAPEFSELVDGAGVDAPEFSELVDGWCAGAPVEPEPEPEPPDWLLVPASLLPERGADASASLPGLGAGAFEGPERSEPVCSPPPPGACEPDEPPEPSSPVRSEPWCSRPSPEPRSPEASEPSCPRSWSPELPADVPPVGAEADSSPPEGALCLSRPVPVTLDLPARVCARA